MYLPPGTAGFRSPRAYCQETIIRILPPNAYACIVQSMVFDAALALRDSLHAPYDDPAQQDYAANLTQQLDDVVRRIAAINAEAQINALRRTMEGLPEPTAMEGAIVDKIANHASNSAGARILRSRIGRKIAKVGIRVFQPEIPGALIDKGVDLAGAGAEKLDKFTKRPKKRESGTAGS